jgi:NAD(P)-dependent dehydrogenase (short-subunit alcohol dehydrogenase family)
MTIENKSVLIIGVTGGMGLQLLRHLAEESSVSEIHALCRNPDKLAQSDKRLCDSIVTGDAKNPPDVEKALIKSKATYVILATGNGMDVSKSDTREKTGQALAKVVAKPQFGHVKVVVVSSHGAADTQIKVGFGIGLMISHHLRHVLSDHTRQEEAFEGLAKRTLIVRPTALSDDKGGKVLVEFDGNKKGPSINADRSDVAAWITEQIAASDFKGRKVCITTAK